VTSLTSESGMSEMYSDMVKPSCFTATSAI